MRYYIFLIYLPIFINFLISTLFCNKKKNNYLLLIYLFFSFLSLICLFLVLEELVGVKGITLNLFRFIGRINYEIFLDKFSVIFMIFINIIFCIFEIFALFCIRDKKLFNMLLMQFNLFWLLLFILISTSNFLIFFMISSLINFTSLKMVETFTNLNPKKLFFKYLVADLLLFSSILLGSSLSIINFNLDDSHKILLYLLMGSSFFIRNFKIFTRFELILAPIYSYNTIIFIYLVRRIRFFENYSDFFIILFCFLSICLSKKILNKNLFSSVGAFISLNLVDALSCAVISRSYISYFNLLSYFLFKNLMFLILFNLANSVNKDLKVENVFSCFKKQGISTIFLILAIAINLPPFGSFFIKANIFLNLDASAFCMILFFIIQSLVILNSLFLLFRIFNYKPKKIFIKRQNLNLAVPLGALGIITIFLGDFSSEIFKMLKIQISNFGVISYFVFVLMNCIIFIFIPKNLKVKEENLKHTKNLRISYLKFSFKLKKSDLFVKNIVRFFRLIIIWVLKYFSALEKYLIKLHIL